VVINRPLHPSNMIHGILPVQSMRLTVIATCFAVVPRLCPLMLVSLSQPFTRNSIHWRSQGLEVGGHRGFGGPPAGSRGRALVGVWGKPPRSQICKICSGQTHFRDVFIEDIWCTFGLMQSAAPTLLLQLFEFVQISRLAEHPVQYNWPIWGDNFW